jgi:hypothetical protein
LPSETTPEREQKQVKEMVLVPVPKFAPMA